MIERLRPEVRLTAQQNLLLAGISIEERSEVNRMLRVHGVVSATDLPPVLRQSMACPALPTCGLALSESERVLPSILSRIEDVMREIGIGGEEIIVRMTGCPNGCARPYMAEIGFVGRAPNK